VLEEAGVARPHHSILTDRALWPMRGIRSRRAQPLAQWDPYTIDESSSEKEGLYVDTWTW